MEKLSEIAHDIGYEWAMLLGAAETDWHLDVPNMPERNPLRVVHLHARTELVWLHARVLHDCLFKEPRRPDDVSVLPFLDNPARTDWNNTNNLRPEHLCPTVHKVVKSWGRANKKLFHLTTARQTHKTGLPPYTIARDELRHAFCTCHDLMLGDKRETFRNGLDDEWDVSTIALTWP
jgi:hypothetical protein